MKVLHRFLAPAVIATVFVIAPLYAVASQQESVAPCDAKPRAWSWLGETHSYYPKKQPVPPPVEITPQLHEAAIGFITAARIRKNMLVHADPFLEQISKSLNSQHPNLNPGFTEEWQKRIKDRLDTDKYDAIWVHEYERYFTTEELNQLTDFLAQHREGNITDVSDALKIKLTIYQEDMLMEIDDGVNDWLDKLGCEVGEEIAKEHPEWAPTPTLKSSK
ncbi:hypothetical protein [Terracidiphilus sp.]|jgi:hypothetical protein|uniref:hypothetical protein n=1 Tax=Terracidiphilus sp. TaxID=1964191 RepID=UPI003C20A08D